MSAAGEERGREYGRLSARALDREAFGSADEGYAWTSAHCGRCEHDRPARQGREQDGCLLIVVSLDGRTPLEWIEDPAPGGGAYICTRYRAEDREARS